MLRNSANLSDPSLYYSRNREHKSPSLNSCLSRRSNPLGACYGRKRIITIQERMVCKVSAVLRCGTVKMRWLDIHNLVYGNGMSYEQMSLALSENNFKGNIPLHTLHIFFFLLLFSLTRRLEAFAPGGSRPMCVTNRTERLTESALISHRTQHSKI